MLELNSAYTEPDRWLQGELWIEDLCCGSSGSRDWSNGEGRRSSGGGATLRERERDIPRRRRSCRTIAVETAILHLRSSTAVTSTEMKLRSGGGGGSRSRGWRSG
ncbi:hypothetical protein LOK49_LG08G01652 [Camellia lanceoleosa]|uniref:Uncharacterized protein n=1 Tax=Camellia lanceoleosa TaxID=1840588 RepID=A0ACC0GQL7_9ERIC|nr:hypothetical protein LOK49_LG08G01652 [Camellia lanceoleosa]